MFGLPSPTMILGAALLLVTAYAVVDTRAYHRGQAECEVRHAVALARAQADAIRAADLASRIEAERLAAEDEALRLALELEDAAMRTLMLTASACLLTACGGSTFAEAPARPAPPPSMTQACSAPQRLPERALSQSEVETLWGRDRGALRACGGRHGALAGWVQAVP